MAYDEKIIAEANRHPPLGAEYFEAREAAEQFLKHWQDEHAAALAEAVIKPILDAVHEKVHRAFVDHFLSDMEHNLAGAMRQMVEDSVKALIGGDQWANVKYISPEGYGTEKVRETLAKLHADPIKDGRIADLEKQVKELNDRIRFWISGH